MSRIIFWISQFALPCEAHNNDPLIAVPICKHMLNHGTHFPLQLRFAGILHLDADAHAMIQVGSILMV